MGDNSALSYKPFKQRKSFGELLAMITLFFGPYALAVRKTRIQMH